MPDLTATDARILRYVADHPRLSTAAIGYALWPVRADGVEARSAQGRGRVAGPCLWRLKRRGLLALRGAWLNEWLITDAGRAALAALEPADA